MNENIDDVEVLVYEVGYHLLPTIDEADVLTSVTQIKSLIDEREGNVIAEEMPKLVALAYDISKSINTKRLKFGKAYFGWIKFEMDPAKILDLKNKIEILPEILRILVIKTVKENTIHTPKIPMFKKEHKEDGMVTSKNFSAPVEAVEKTEISEEEMDKSIDELVDKQTL